MRTVLLSAGLVLSLFMHASIAQTALVAKGAADMSCSWNGKKYSPGAVVIKDKRQFRCSEVYLDELNTSPVAAWVELSAALAPMR